MQGHATDYRFPTVDNRQKFPNLRIPKDDCFFLQFLIQGKCISASTSQVMPKKIYTHCSTSTATILYFYGNGNWQEPDPSNF